MRVLFVDDKPYLVRGAVWTLTRNGYEVETAGDGAEALTKIEANPPDLVVCDVLMPVMGGFELMKILRIDKQLTDLKIIILVNCSPQGPRPPVYERKDGPNSPWQDANLAFLLKPIGRKELLFAVGDMLTPR